MATSTGITISKGYLASVVKNSIGVQTTLTVRTQGKGIELPIDIVQYTTPNVPSANVAVADTTQDLHIPLSWQGTTLATMRAYKADGTILKDDWTVWLGPMQAGCMNL